MTLSRVCEEYLANLRQVEQREPEEVADFLLIAAKLLYLKSLVLLPGQTSAEVVDTTGLAEQLRLYRIYLEASQGIAERYAMGAMLYPTTRAPVVTATFLPPPGCTAEVLSVTFSRILADLEPIVRIPRAVIGRKISIDDRIAEIRDLMLVRPQTTFQEVLRGRWTRDEQIVSFLALLELVKQRVVEVTQEDRFAPIRISRASDQQDAVSVALLEEVPN